MNSTVVICFIIIGICILLLIAYAEMTPEQKDNVNFGRLNPDMKCPHCDTTGNIRTKGITQKKGISGGKAAAGLMTGGVSLLAVGLSRTEKSTEARCGKCKNVWHF